MSLGATLSKKVGPMPLGAWLLVGSGGLYMAYRQKGAEAAPAPAGDSLPTGGGYGATSTFDGAPVVLSPVIQITTPVPPKTGGPTIMPVPTPKPKPTPAPRLPAPKGTKPKPSTSRRYVVKSGDTLWSIAQRQLGNGLRWTTIYALNKSVIDTEAKKHGKPGGGHWIFPGTELRLTK